MRCDPFKSVEIALEVPELMKSLRDPKPLPPPKAEE